MAEEEIAFSPILIMEFIRQTTVGRFLNKEDVTDFVVKFKISKKYYDEILAYPLQAQTIRLNLQYDESSEILEVRAEEILINRFREQKSQVEIASKYENQYAERYKKFIEVIE